MAVRYGRGKFDAHENYIRYMNMIADSQIYHDMPNLRSPDGRINWQVSTGKTTSFNKYYNARFDWWVRIADSLGLPGTGNSNDRFSIAARMIHPTKTHACRLCGEDIYIGYMYLNANLAKRWKSISHTEHYYKQQLVVEAAMELAKRIGKDYAEKELIELFPERKDYEHLLKENKYFEYFFSSQHIRSTYLSPGFMANPPDRLDGLHDYCLHCRKKSDPGRSDENMRTYNHDRRAFMWWAEGDWKVADALYNSSGEGVCAICGSKVDKISPDHIGPLSCGFKQIPYFEALCGRCNSSKNRRFTFDNVISLLRYEEKFESVASWQVRALWDSVKYSVKNDSDAKVLSNYLRAMQDYYLRMLFYIQQTGNCAVLAGLLHPEYAYYDISFQGLNPSTLQYDEFNKNKMLSSGYRSLAARSIRIAFEELFAYCEKPPERRKINKTFVKFQHQDKPEILKLLKSFEKDDYTDAWNKVIFNSEMSTDEKDGEIRTLIESADYNRMKNYHSTFYSKFEAIISTRGQTLGNICYDELKLIQKKEANH